MKQEVKVERGGFVGIDVSSDRLDVAFRPAGERLQVGNDPRGITRLTTIDDLREASGFVVGTPKEVVQRLKEIITRLGVGHMLFEGQYGGLPHDLTMRSIELMGKEVLPALRKELTEK